MHSVHRVGVFWRAGIGAAETGMVMAETELEFASVGETGIRMLPPGGAGQPPVPFSGMPMMPLRPRMPAAMPPNFRGMMMPFVSRSLLFFVVLIACRVLALMSCLVRLN